MRKWISLILITALFLCADLFFREELGLHVSFRLMVLFFSIQTFVLFRMDQWVPTEWSVHVSLAKIMIRLLSSMVFIMVLMLRQDDLFHLVIQFILIYLVYLIFEIGTSLTNLRRN